MILALTKKKKFCCLKRNYQVCYIGYLIVVSTYNFQYLKNVFTKSFSKQDKINCSINNSRVIP